MRSDSNADTNVLLSTVIVMGVAVLLSLTGFVQFLEYRLADLWWLVCQIF